MLGGVAFGPGHVDRGREGGEAGGVAGVEVGVVERVLVAGDLGFQRVDATGEEVVVALVLVGELGWLARWCRRGYPSTTLRVVPLPPLRAGRHRPLPFPILIAAGDD